MIGNIRYLTALLLSCVLSLALAGGPSQPSQSSRPSQPEHMPNVAMPAFNFFTPKPSFLKQVTHQHAHRRVRRVHYVTLYPGSLKSNIVRIARSFGWKHIIWTSQDDYHWIGKIRVAADNLPYILRKILQDYPLQANFYDGNHILVIKPRTIQA